MAEGTDPDSCAGNGAMSWWHSSCSSWERALRLRGKRMAKDAPGSGGESVRLTLEVSWGIPRNKAVLAGGGVEANGSKPDRRVRAGVERRAGDRRGGLAAAGIAIGRRVGVSRPRAVWAPVPTGAGGLGSSPRGECVFGSKRRSTPASLCEAAISPGHAPAAGDPGKTPAYAAAVAPDGQRRAPCLGFAGRRPGRAGSRRDRRAGDRGSRLGRVQHPLARVRRGRRSDDGRSPLDSRGRRTGAL